MKHGECRHIDNTQAVRLAWHKIECCVDGVVVDHTGIYPMLLSKANGDRTIHIINERMNDKKKKNIKSNNFGNYQGSVHFLSDSINWGMSQAETERYNDTNLIYIYPGSGQKSTNGTIMDILYRRSLEAVTFTIENHSVISVIVVNFFWRVNNERSAETVCILTL